MPKVTQIRQEQIYTGPLPVAAYCRVSTDSTDQLHSYAAQIKEYTERIGQNPKWVLADIYCDEGLTGTKAEKRDDLQRLIADCRRGKVGRVLVKSVSRFARNTYDSLAVTRLLKTYGVSVYFEEQDIDTATMSDEVLLTMQSMSAQGESQTLSQNMRWSYQERMKKGEFFGNTPAYGYKLAGTTMEILEPEAEVVRRIFALYLTGLGKQAIANLLTAEDVPRRYGHKRWYAHTVDYVINNERYIGDALLQKKYTTEFPFIKKTNKGELPQYYVENSHPPIISREDFDAAQKLQESKRRREYKQNRHTLTGKILCPDCGHPFRRMMINNTAYWTCAHQASGAKKCQPRRYPEEVIQDAFLLLINKLTVHREYLLTPLIAGMEQVQRRHSGTRSKVYEIDKQIAELNAQNHRIAGLFASGAFDAADFAAKTSAVSNQVSALRSQRRKLLAEDENDALLDELTGLDNILSLTAPQTSFDGELFGQVVEHIAAATDTDLRFRLKGGLELTETLSYRKRR